jgi:UDP-N-acetylglucosamine--N-acetylmuramyl-(pentapeptide) pyrophosphoryl-undecaprenol N-acetylglucosamine transferase
VRTAAGHALTVVFAGGGTGGHLYPAIAVAEELRRIRPDTEVVFVGTRGKIEARVVPQHGFRFEPIWISGLRRSLAPSNLLFPVKVAVALAQSAAILRRVGARAVLGTGGYVSGPVLGAAVAMGIPTLLHESNSEPGITTRMLAARVDEVHVTFERTLARLPGVRGAHVTGNPTRGAIGTVSRTEGAGALGLRADLPVLLVMGGSLGAASINRAVARLLPALTAAGLQVLWQTGKTDEEAMRSAAAGLAGVRVSAFIDRMECAYAAADLAVCRAGATTLAELARAGLPAVLVPYPLAAADHQTENARAMQDAGAALMVPDAGLETGLGPAIERLMRDPESRRTMGTRARTLGKPDAAAVLARAVLARAERRP